MSKKTHKLSRGFSSLIVVMFLSLMLELVLFSVVLMSRVSLYRSLSSSYSQEAYYAAEGVLSDTLLLLRKGNWPVSTPYNQAVKIGSVTVNRNIQFDKNKQTYSVEIESELKSVKRKLFAQFTPEKVEKKDQKKVQTVFILDTSDSMKTTLSTLKTAVSDTIDSGTFAPSDELAIVEFGTKSRVVSPFTLDRQKIKTDVQGLRTTGGTNTVAGLQTAYDLIQKSGDPNAIKIIILFSDGVPTLGLNSKNSQIQCEEGCYKQYFGNNYSPNNGGNQCTDSTIKTADQMHGSTEVLVYTVFFARGGGGACNDVSTNQQLGRLTLQQIAGDHNRYFETDQLGQLKGIFQAIGTNVVQSKNASYFYQEVEPSESL